MTCTWRHFISFFSSRMIISLVFEEIMHSRETLVKKCLSNKHWRNQQLISLCLSLTPKLLCKTQNETLLWQSPVSVKVTHRWHKLGTQQGLIIHSVARKKFKALEQSELVKEFPRISYFQTALMHATFFFFLLKS